MKKFSLLFMTLFTVCFFSANINAQTNVFTANDGGFQAATSTFAANGWTEVNDGNNKWYVGTATSFAGTKAAYIDKNNTAGSTNTYNVNNANVCHFYRDFTIPGGATSVTLTFRWRCAGESIGATLYDYLRVFVVPNTTTPAAGVELATGQVGTTYLNQGTAYQLVTLTLTGVAGTTSRLVFSWTNDNSAGTQPPAAVDAVQISYIPAVGCTGTPNAGNITATGGITSFCGSATTTLTLNGATVGTGISYLWEYFNGSTWQTVGTNATTLAVNNITSTTQYRVTTTCSNTPASATATPVTLTVNPNPIMSVSPTDTFICTVGGSVTLTASGNATSYAWSPAIGLNMTTGNTVIASPTSGKAYTVTGTLGSCSVSAITSVNVVTPPTLTTTATPATICSGGNTQLATTQLGGGDYWVYPIAPYILTPSATTVALDQTISPPQGNLDDGRTGAIPLPFTFSFYGTAQNSIFIGTNGVVGFTGAGFQNNNTAQSVPAAANPDNVIGLFWADLNLTTSGSVTYGVTGTAPNRRFVITYTNVPAYNSATANNTGQVILHETTNFIDVVITSSTYLDFKTIGIENANASEGLAAPGRNATQWTVTSGAPEAYRFAVTNFNYAWTPITNLSNPGIPNPQATNLTSPVTYTVNVQNSVTKCISSGSAAVAVNPLPTASISTSTATICQGQTGTVIFTGTPNATVTYNINGGGPQNITLDGAGNFALTTSALNVTSNFNLVSALSAQNCPATLSGSATINVNPRPTAVLGGNDIICDGATGYIQINPGAGASPWSVTITDNNANSFTEVITGTALIPVTVSTTTTYDITGLFDANCTAIAGDYSGTATVNVNPRPTATLSSSAPLVCDGDNVTLTVTMTGTQPFTFELNDGVSNTLYTGINANTFDIPVSPTTATTYELNFIQDANCFSQPSDIGPSVTLDYHTRPTATISGDNTICNGDMTPLTFNLTGTGPWSVEYYDNVGNTMVAITGSPEDVPVSPVVTTNYILATVSDIYCPAISAGMTGSATVTVNQLPTITTPPVSDARCIGDMATFTINATGTGLMYQWLENGSPLPNGGIYSGVDGQTLTISDLTGLDGNVYEVSVSGTCPPDVTSAPATLTVNTINTWTGDINTLWSETGNWGCGILPNEHTDVVIPSPLANMPDIDIPTAICKSLNISAGADVEFIGIGSALEVKEDIYANGVLDGSAGKVILSGTGAQTIPGIIYGSIDVEGGSDKTFGGSATITGDLNLTSGYVVLWDNDLTLSENATVSNASAASFVITNGMGVVVKENMGTGANTGTILFPVGSNAASYTPMSIANAGTADNINVRVIDGVWDTYNVETPNGTLQTENAVNKTWFINEDVPGGSDATVTPQWNLLDELALFNNGSCEVSHYNIVTNAWEDSPMAPAAGSGPFSQTRTGVVSFSPFGVGSENSPLPLGLISFKGRMLTDDALLQWASVNEFNMKDYELQRSVNNGKEFSTIATQKVTGNNKNGANDYTYTDADVRSLGKDKLLYRLKMNEVNGKKPKYSKVVAIHIGSKIKKGMIEAYPNPVTANELFVRLADGGDEAISISVTDMQGKTISTVTYKAGEYKADAIPVDVTQLAQGMYMLRVVGAEDNNTIDVLKFNRQ